MIVYADVSSPPTCLPGPPEGGQRRQLPHAPALPAAHADLGTRAAIAHCDAREGGALPRALVGQGEHGFGELSVVIGYRCGSADSKKSWGAGGGVGGSAGGSGVGSSGADGGGGAGGSSGWRRCGWR